MNKHTPGPWKFTHNDGNEFELKSNDDLIIGGCGCCGSRWISNDADANLIGAAPELLEACKMAFDQTCSVGRPKDWEQLRTAIAKATGEHL